MEVTEKRLDEIHPYERNPRINDKAVDAVAESIKSYGFKVPIVISSTGEIVCGHTCYKAAIELGMETVPCVVADGLTEDQIRAFRIADNKTSDFSLWDNKLLLEELDIIPDDLFTGFEDAENFESILDEKDKSVIDDNEYGVMYEAVFRSEDAGKIERIKELWETLEETYSSQRSPENDLGE